MGQGYTRNDTGNNIADGNIINASDLDGEFDAVESAFNESTGHTHDGTAAEGAPITVLGPVQDFIASATEIKPKTTNTLDIGTAALQFKDMYLDGAAYIGNISVDGNTISSTDTNGNLTIDPNGTGNIVLDANVGIGTASPSEQLHVIGDIIASGYLRVASTQEGGIFDTTGNNGLTVTGSTGSPASTIRAYTGGSEKMRIDSSGKVGIGITNPVYKLVVSAGGASGIEFGPAYSGTANLVQHYSRSGASYVDAVNEAAQHRFYIGGSEKMRIDSSGNVGIGTASMVRTLEITDGTSGKIRAKGTDGGFIECHNGTNGVYFGTAPAVLGSGSGGDSVLFTDSGFNQLYYTGGAERMRILSTGDVALGNTAANLVSNTSTQGGGGYVVSDKHFEFATDSNRSAVEIGKNNANDGQLVLFRKQGTAVGSIGTASGGVSLGSGDTGLYFEPVSNEIRPFNTTTNASIDNAINLGNSTRRFKDLYLSGDIQVGDGFNLSWGGSYGSGYPTVYATTGSGGFITFAPNGNTPSTNQVRIVGEGIEFGAASSNLDDYEEGTWTPAFNASVTNPTVTAQGNSTGRYVKIGNIVHFWFYDSGTTISGAGSGFASVSGLPYTNEAGYYPVFQYEHGTHFATASSGGYVSAGTNTCIFIQRDTISTVLWATGTKYMMISGTYKTA